MTLQVYPEPFKMEYYAAVANGDVTGHSIMNAMGERLSMGTTSTGEDIWRGTATSIPMIADAGVQMYVVSTSAEDGVAGTGVLTLDLQYLEADGTAANEVITMDGLTPVQVTDPNVRFVNDMYGLTVGTNGVAVGDITVYLSGDATSIYNMIAIGGNKSLVPHRMVPLAKTLILKGWQCTEAQGKRVAFRIRSTDMNGVLIPGVFCFKDTAFIKTAATGELQMNINVPALSIVKVSGWPIVTGAEGSCSWWGLLIDD